MKRALILGIGGQDGSYLADILLERGYEVHGLYRRSSNGNLRRIAHVLDRVTLHQGDMADGQSVERAIVACQPHEMYNEADQDSVGWSHAAPDFTADITYGAVGRLLESVRSLNPSIRIFQPCSAMMFGDAALLTDPSFPQTQNEETPFHPQSPYACAKVGAYHLCQFYRKVHGMFVSVGILYNHDNPRRTDEYLLHKVCKAAVCIARGEQQSVALGNLDARVDIGYAKEYMAAAHAMLQLDKPDNFVIATGVTRTVEEIVNYAFHVVGIQLERRRDLITVDPKFYKPGVQGTLCGDYTKASLAFGFAPKHTAFELIDLIILEGMKCE